MIKSDLNEKWRQWKGDLKAAEFDSSKTIDEIVSGIELRDARIDEVQFRGLVEYWFTDKAKVSLSHTYYKSYTIMRIIMTNILYQL